MHAVCTMLPFAAALVHTDAWTALEPEDREWEKK